MSAALHPAIVITIGQIRAGQAHPKDLLRMAQVYLDRNEVVRKAHLPIYDGDRGYARFLRQRFPLSSIAARQNLAAQCRRAYQEEMRRRPD